MTIFIILQELAFVFNPEVVEEVPVVIRELLLQLLRLLIEQLTITVELLVLPLAVICWEVLPIIQHTLAAYLVVVEVSLVICTVVVNQFAITLFQPILAHTLILHPILIFLLQINQIRLLFFHHRCFYLTFHLR